MLAMGSPEVGVKLYLEAALTADRFASGDNKKYAGEDAFGQIAYELISQSFALYEEHSGDSQLQRRCIVSIVGTLLACRSLVKEDYESLIMKTAQYAAKMLKKPDQCEMVALCSHLFYVVGEGEDVHYSNPQRGLECLQRALKLADACTTANPANLKLFVDLLDHYLYFFEKKNPSITGNYISGLVALIKEHADNLGQFGGADTSAVGEAKTHFLEIVRHIKEKKGHPDSSALFANIEVGTIGA
jgi:vacuolar protein sorting-associated protein 35